MAESLTSDQLLEAMKSYALGIIKGNTADTLGAPVDLFNAALAPITQRLGIYSDEPIGGSKKFRKLFNQSVEDKNVAETAGSMLSIGGAAKAMIVGAARLGKAGKVELELAKEILAEGQGNANAFNAAGVYKDKGALKGVISDQNARYNLNTVGEMRNAPYGSAGTVRPLPDVLQHPELYDLYPELKDVTVSIEDLKGPLGQARLAAKHLAIDPSTLTSVGDNNFRSVLGHEVQHMIQNIEGWQAGGSARQFIPFNPAKVQEKITVARESNDPAVKAAAERFKTIANMKIREAGNRYSNLPGEQEARYTQETMNMSLPELTSDVLALIRSGNTPTTYDTRPIRPVFGGGDVTFKP